MDSNAPRPRRAWYQWHWFTWIVVLGLVAVFAVGNTIGFTIGFGDDTARDMALDWSGGFPLRFVFEPQNTIIPVNPWPGGPGPTVRPEMLFLNIVIGVVLIAGAVCYLERRFMGQRSRFSMGSLMAAITWVAMFCALARWSPAIIEIPICGVLMLGLVGVFDSVLWLLRRMLQRLWRGNRRLE
jgi:hypothetical protein